MNDTTKPPRITVSKPAVEFGEYSFRGSLNDLQAFVNSLVDRYGPDATVGRVYDAYDDDVNYGVFVEREETDAEYAKRCEWLEQQAKRDRQQYLALKKRFGE